MLFQLEADEELNQIGNDPNNIAFDLFEVRAETLFWAVLGRSQHSFSWHLIFNLFKVKNGRSDDVRWEEKKEEEVRRAEEEQVEDLKEFVNLKLPGAFMGLQKVNVCNCSFVWSKGSLQILHSDPKLWCPSSSWNMCFLVILSSYSGGGQWRWGWTRPRYASMGTCKASISGVLQPGFSFHFPHVFLLNSLRRDH